MAWSYDFKFGPDTQCQKGFLLIKKLGRFKCGRKRCQKTLKKSFKVVNIGHFFKTARIYDFKFSLESLCEGLFMDIKWSAYCKGGRRHNQESLIYPKKAKKCNILPLKYIFHGFQCSFLIF